MEISPAYCDVIVKRWQEFCGEAAELDGDGRTFDQISDARYDSADDALGSYHDGLEAKRDAQKARSSKAGNAQKARGKQRRAAGAQA